MPSTDNAMEPTTAATKESKIGSIVQDRSFNCLQESSRVHGSLQKDTLPVTQQHTAVSATLTLNKIMKSVCTPHKNPYKILNTQTKRFFETFHTPFIQNMGQSIVPMAYPIIPPLLTLPVPIMFYQMVQTSQECASYPVSVSLQKNPYKIPNTQTQSIFDTFHTPFIQNTGQSIVPMVQLLKPPLLSIPVPVPVPQFNVPNPNIPPWMVSTMNTTSQGQVTPSTPVPVPVSQFNVPLPNIPPCMVSTMNTPSTPVPVPVPQFNVPPPNISQCMVPTMNTTSQGQVTYQRNVSQIPLNRISQFTVPPPAAQLNSKKESLFSRRDLTNLNLAATGTEDLFEENYKKSPAVLSSDEKSLLKYPSVFITGFSNYMSKSLIRDLISCCGTVPTLTVEHTNNCQLSVSCTFINEECRHRCLRVMHKLVLTQNQQNIWTTKVEKDLLYKAQTILKAVKVSPVWPAIQMTSETLDKDVLCLSKIEKCLEQYSGKVVSSSNPSLITLKDVGSDTSLEQLLGRLLPLFPSDDTNENKQSSDTSLEQLLFRLLPLLPSDGTDKNKQSSDTALEPLLGRLLPLSPSDGTDKNKQSSDNHKMPLFENDILTLLSHGAECSNEQTSENANFDIKHLKIMNKDATESKNDVTLKSVNNINEAVGNFSDTVIEIDTNEIKLSSNHLSDIVLEVNSKTNIENKQDKNYESTKTSTELYIVTTANELVKESLPSIIHCSNNSPKNCITPDIIRSVPSFGSNLVFKSYSITDNSNCKTEEITLAISRTNPLVPWSLITQLLKAFNVLVPHNCGQGELDLIYVIF